MVFQASIWTSTAGQLWLRNAPEAVVKMLTRAAALEKLPWGMNIHVKVTHWVAGVSLLFWVTGSSPKGCSQHRTGIIKVSDASHDQDRSQDHFLNRFIEIDFTYPAIFIHIFRVLYPAMMSNYNHAKTSPTPPEDHSLWQWLLQALLGLGNHSLQDLTL